MRVKLKRRQYKKKFRAKLNRRIYKIAKNECAGLIILIIKEVSYISVRQFIALKFRINKILKKKGRCLFLFTPNQVKTTKKSSRMGKGKGTEKTWYVCTQPGMSFCQIESLNLELAKKAVWEIKKRFPCTIRILINEI